VTFPASLPLDDPAALAATRTALQQVAVHVLARRRHAVTGRFGLRPAPGGIATPAFGDEVEVVRTCGRLLVVERGARAVSAELTTLAEAAELAGVDVTGAEAAGFSVGRATPPLPDPDAALAVDDGVALALGDWFAFGSSVIDEVVATTPAVVGATTRQLWPEHFDLAGAVTVATGPAPEETEATEVKANVGVSPGDGAEPSPYLYIGPWTDDRPGNPGYWNVPFGAALRADELRVLPPADARARAVAFLRHGLDLLTDGFRRP
jgi:hypothetical protein